MFYEYDPRKPHTRQYCIINLIAKNDTYIIAILLTRSADETKTKDTGSM